MLASFSGKTVLLLQGPIGPFFRRLATDLEAIGARVVKVNLNSGDVLFYPEGLRYQGTRAEWPAYVAALVAREGVDAAFLFGDARPYHVAAKAVLRECAVPFFVFEEGYLRPDHITVEPFGVNGNSTMPKDPEVYRRLADLPASPVSSVRHAFEASVLWAVLYGITLTAGSRLFPTYQHHRDQSPLRQAYYWGRAVLRKYRYQLAEAKEFEALTTTLRGRFFLVPLQVHNDAQIGHSPYTDVDQFIREVVASFAQEASPDAVLVLKHHPMDRGYRDYTSLVNELRRKHALDDRLRYVHDLHLPTLIRAARGVIVINSTVGLSSVFHGTPTKVMGAAIYDIPGVVSGQSLEEFWHEPERHDDAVVRGLRNYLLRKSQVNGSFYVRGSGVGSGLHWTGVDFLPEGASSR